MGGGSGNVQTRASRRGSTLSISASAVTREWAKLLFRSPTLFENMVELTERMSGHIRDALTSREGRSSGAITFPLATVRKRAQEGLKLCADSKIKYQWKIHIKDSRCHAVLRLRQLKVLGPEQERLGEQDSQLAWIGSIDS